ncbi:aromatic acid exporter family protein [Salipaludibacillus agaradhaerens]|uniref:Aromatic acid exporter family protein n=1 Tax=Salipaludibacillus agaradhaerens TaxID=76935 RepID=A0A9Q4FYM9_SALAG|nr:aromatic acid exporter family protein [Salipaludibacillus agaradhaerens]MCR6096302.1 aromatic acid exporter family protein [Salipaludibacillus agaradhaerens]MCR6114139.1 aromatic acid exporter family protein [Salipaludibacillus agaradhaerens]
MLPLKHYTKFIKKPGSRLIKTAIAVFVTSFICLLLDLPAIFAVITAIVTIEPSTQDSIRKGMERFPASAIGAALAAISVYFFGQSATSYTLAAILTIFLCEKFKLRAGTLVATLTAVAMIPDLHDHLIYSFFSRLGTTSIGLIVSTSVNLLILPANYLDTIKKRNHLHVAEINRLLSRLLDTATSRNQTGMRHFDHSSYTLLKRHLEKTEQLLAFQRKELRFHRFKMKKFRTFIKERRTTDYLQRILLHLGNLHYLSPSVSSTLTYYEQTLLKRSQKEFHYLMTHIGKPIIPSFFETIDELNNHLKYEFIHTKPPTITEGDHHQLSEKIIIFYELLSIHDVLEDLYYHLSSDHSNGGNKGALITSS